MPRAARWSWSAIAVLLATLGLTTSLLCSAEKEAVAKKAEPPSPEDLVQAASGGKDAAAADVRDDKATYRVFNIEFDGAANATAFKVQDVHVLARFDRFADIMIPLDAMGKPEGKVLERFRTVKGITHVDASKVIAVPIPPAPGPEVGLKGKGSEKYVHGGLNGLDGMGVLIAVLDTGIDFRHPDFIEENAGQKTSRLLHFWDTSRTHDPKGPGQQAPAVYPNGTSIGTLYSRADLTGDLRDGKKALGEFDLGGHGTACAGIAAGNGRGEKENKFAGVAPKATLIGVRLGAKGGLENTYLLNAICQWLEDVAAKEKKPLVVSCSFGGQHGSRDGSYVRERHLSKRYENSPGRLLCIAVGNEGNKKIHAVVQFSDAEQGLLTWDSEIATRMTICIDGIEPDAVSVTPLEKNQAEVVGKERHWTGTTKLSVDISKGRGGLKLAATRKVEKPLRADAYFAYETDKDHKQLVRFIGDAVKNELQISSPATTLGCFAVGSYDFNDEFHQGKMRNLAVDGAGTPMNLGTISAYSNAGYLRNSEYLPRGVVVIKPDLVAPGQYFTAPAAPSVLEDFRGTNTAYRVFNGTSAATPYTAGVFALLLQKKPDLTAENLRELLAKHMTKDAQTGNLPNTTWGRGKLDYAAVERLVGALK
jgi:subtilisin family serine protease